MSSSSASIPMPTPTLPPRPLSTYKVISFDVYGTLIEYKQAILHSFSALISSLPTSSPYRNTTPLSPHIANSATTGDIEFLKLFQRQEDAIKLELAENPARFDEVLREIWTRISREVGVDVDESAVKKFGSEENVKSWGLFHGSETALRKLQDLPGSGGVGDTYKLVALSNIDKWATDITFTASGLGHVKWEKVFTAEDFGTSAEDLKLADQRKFEKLLEYAESIGVPKDQILHVAQSLGHDHKPAKDAGILSAFLVGDGAVWGKEEESKMAVEKGLVGYGWRCADLKQLVDLIEEGCHGTE